MGACQNNPFAAPVINVGDAERQFSAGAGAVLLLLGLRGRSLLSLLPAVIGGGLVYRGLTGFCPLYDRMGLTTAEGGYDDDRLDQGSSRDDRRQSPEYTEHRVRGPLASSRERPPATSEVSRAATGELAPSETSSEMQSKSSFARSEDDTKYSGKSPEPHAARP